MTASSNRVRGHIGLISLTATLSREDENRLLTQIETGRSAALELANSRGLSDVDRTNLRRLVRAGRRGEDELIAGTCALVKKRVNDLGFAFDQDELELAGVEGLARALRDFDRSKGVRFATYANYWVSKLVFDAVSHRVRLPDDDVRKIIRLRRLLRNSSGRVFSQTELAKQLDVPRAQLVRLLRLSDEISTGSAALDETNSPVEPEPWPEAEWIIDSLREILGDDFEDFWLWTGRVMSLEELGRRRGISKQAMAKRVAKSKRLVESSPRADSMVAWLNSQ